MTQLLPLSGVDARKKMMEETLVPEISFRSKRRNDSDFYEDDILVQGIKLCRTVSRWPFQVSKQGSENSNIAS